jgi:hypothetical protein
MAEIEIPDWMNNSFFEKALSSGGYGPNVTVTSSEIGRATNPGDNYMCDILRAKLQVTLDGRRSTLTLIVKFQPDKEEMAKVNILFCLVLHIGDMRRILNRNTRYIFSLHMYQLHINICSSIPVRGLEWPRGFQEVKVPRYPDNGTGCWYDCQT